MTLRELVFQMRVDDWEARQAAGNALRARGEAAIPELIALLHAQDSTLSGWVSKIGEEFTTPAHDWHAYAASALGEIGPAASSAIPDLLNARREELTQVSLEHREFVTTRARAALIKIRLEPLDLLEAELLDSRAPGFGAALATAQELGGYARPLIPSLEQVFRDRSAPKRYSIINAIGRIDGAGKLSTSVLLAALSDEDQAVRWFALRALNHAEAPSSELRAAIAERLTDSVRSVRQQAIETLVSVAPHDERRACAGLIEPLLEDSAEEVRATARLALAKL